MDIRDNLDNWQDLYDWTDEEIEEGMRIAELKKSVSQMPNVGLSEILINSAYENEDGKKELSEVHLWYKELAYEYHCVNNSDLIKLLLKREMDKLEEERIELINKHGRHLMLV
ncbi:hypothetical protein [Paenibacillus sp. FSL H3-0286]|uniref:hypothetical protein n=1 Tax=Paenibacillus sp. FSL H3-0286 TaxID=2921427 RepID=UPI00324CDC2C